MKIHLTTRLEPGREIIFEHWIRNHKSRVDSIAVAIHDNGGDLQEIFRICEKHEIIKIGVLKCEFSWPHFSEEIKQWSKSIRDRHEDWIVDIDVDEFIPPEYDIRAIAKECQTRGYWWARAWMCDRHAPGGELVPMSPDIPPYEQFPVRSRATRDIMKSADMKCWLYPAGESGLKHSFSDDERQAMVHPTWWRLDHFKWHGNLYELTLERLALQEGQDQPWVYQVRNLVEHLENFGRIKTEDCMSSRCEEIEGENWFDFDHIYRTAYARIPDGGIAVELGTFLGRSAVYFAELIQAGTKRIRFDCVDRFRLCDTLFERFKWKGKSRDYLDRFSAAIQKLGLAPFINAIQADSWEAARLYEDGSVHFVFIDAGHDFESVMRDLKAWFPKLHEDGILAGHDYQTHPTVGQAVDQFAKETGLRVETSRTSWILAP